MCEYSLSRPPVETSQKISLSKASGGRVTDGYHSLIISHHITRMAALLTTSILRKLSQPPLQPISQHCRSVYIPFLGSQAPGIREVDNILRPDHTELSMSPWSDSSGCQIKECSFTNLWIHDHSLCFFGNASDPFWSGYFSVPINTTEKKWEYGDAVVMSLSNWNAGNSLRSNPPVQETPSTESICRSNFSAQPQVFTIQFSTLYFIKPSLRSQHTWLYT